MKSDTWAGGWVYQQEPDDHYRTDSGSKCHHPWCILQSFWLHFCTVGGSEDP